MPIPFANQPEEVIQFIYPDNDRERINHTSQPISMTYGTCDGQNISFTMIHPGQTEYVRMPAGNTLMHRHDYFEMLYVLEGEVRQHIESSILHYHPGEALLMNRNIRHSESSTTPFSAIFLNIRPEYFLEILAGDILVDENRVSAPSDGEIHRFLRANLQGEEQYTRSYLHFSPTLYQPDSRADKLLDQLSQELLAQKNGAAHMVAGLLARFIGLLENPQKYHITRMAWDSDNEDFIYANIVNYLRERKGNLSREELSLALHYHAEYLNQIVKRKAGMSLMQLGRTYRLEEAKRLLTETDQSISDIIQELGYVSRSHFYRFFEKETGLLPSEYRKQSR